MITSMLLRLIVLFGILMTAPFAVIAQSDDLDAPEISNVKVASSTATSITVTWETDEDADSAINYSLQPDLGVVRKPVADRTNHSITIDNLEAGKTYYFRVVSADENGNQGISADYKIESPESSSQTTESTTQNTVKVESQTTQEIVEQINQITNPQQLQEILNETIKAIKGITEDLTIVGPPTVEPETTFAIVKWTTDRPASGEVVFSPTSGFNGTNYAFSQSSTGDRTTDHEIRLIGLDPFTEYSFQVRSTDEYGITGESRNYTFRTKASLPDIRNLRIVKVEENAATLAWDTTVPAKALIEYQDLTTGVQNSVGRPTLATTHQMRLADLTLGTRYVAFVIAENSGGDRVRSQPIQFITVRDIAPPIITNVTNESTIFPGGESRIQTIVEWNTDEAASCLMTYREGVAGGVDPVTIEQENVQYTTSHVEVIVDFAPATVYQFWLNCTDEAKNTIQSENFVLFTPIQEKNIIDLILENFESTFGWVKNITN
jgi:Purple acid Phosphatase, N-terminal domain